MATTASPPTTPHLGDDLVPIVRVDPISHQLVDEQGNTRFFRGMAVAYKALPFIPVTDKFDPVFSFSQVDMDLFKRLNLNIIRLAVPWAAVQPREGPDGFDEEYLANITALVRRCKDAGIYVLIEAHQDLFSARFCGNGMPSWAVTRDFWTLPFPWPVSFFWARYKDRDSYPSDNTCGPCNSRTRPDWGKFYGSDAVTRSFYGLYTDERVQSAFVAFWEKMAHTFSSEPNIIGYELLNEPFVASRTSIGVPYNLWRRSRTETKYLQPLYDRLSLAIRKIDSRTLIWYEPATGGGSDAGKGFRSTPGGEDAKSVMSFHSYGPNVVDTQSIEQAVELRWEQVNKLGGGLALTEFDCEYDRGLGRIRDVMELADDHLVNWIGWQYSKSHPTSFLFVFRTPTNPPFPTEEFVHVAGSPPSGTLFDPKTGLPRRSMLKLFSRPYPSSVAGTVLSFHFDWATSLLRFVYTPLLGGGWTTIAINEDADAGWGNWLVTVEKARGDGEGEREALETLAAEVEKNSSRVRVRVLPGWGGGNLVVLLKQTGVVEEGGGGVRGQRLILQT